MRWLGVVATTYAVLGQESGLLFEDGVLTSGTAEGIPFFAGEGKLEQIVLHGGKQEGSLVLKITTADLDIYVSPSRGMNIMNMTVKTEEENYYVGWSNPVKGVVNPAYVNLMERDGSGFLQGFNEMVARCGYQWAGHAGYDGDDFLTLHGLMANTPADEVSYEVTDTQLTVTGKIRLSTFKKMDFEVDARLIVTKGSRQIWLEDTLTNLGDYPAEYMAIYHANFGAPLLSANSKVFVPTNEVSPFNAEAVPLLDAWDTITPPSRGYDETVYNIIPYANSDGDTLAVMANEDEDLAIAVRWRVAELPVFGLWKNLDTEGTGYVVGLEPGTSFSYNRRWNREIDLVPTLDSAESVTFRTGYQPLLSAAEVASHKYEVETIQGSRPIKVVRTPLTWAGKAPTVDAATPYVLTSLTFITACVAAFLL